MLNISNKALSTTNGCKRTLLTFLQELTPREKTAREVSSCRNGKTALNLQRQIPQSQYNALTSKSALNRIYPHKSGFAIVTTKEGVFLLIQANLVVLPNNPAVPSLSGTRALIIKMSAPFKKTKIFPKIET